MIKTKITALLDQEGVAYRVLPHSSPSTSIVETAAQRGIPTSKMVKSILLRDMDDNYIIACVPGNKPVDPKKIRAFLKCRRITCVSLNEVEAVTGYQVGTISPLLLKFPIPIFFDSSLLDMQEITISSGCNMAGIALNIHDLISLCRPQITDIIRD